MFGGIHYPGEEAPCKLLANGVTSFTVKFFMNSSMISLPFYAALSAALGIFGLVFTPGYNPSFDFGIALILLGFHLRGPNDREA